MTRKTTTTLHPPPAELANFALGSLDDQRAAVVEGHVYRCDRCAAIVANVPADEFLKQLQASHQFTNADGDAGASASSQDTVGLSLDYVNLVELPPEVRNHPHFEIKRLIAEGAMGRVYLAQARDAKQYVALKVMRPDFADDRRKVKRFLQESRIAEMLRHPNIARVIGCESSGHSTMIAMEYVRGCSLAQLVGRRGPLPVDEAREFVRQAAEGLAYAARHGVVHRDIKPHNLMFDQHAKLIKIVDFGLGQLVDEQRNGSRLTRDNEILGTLDYISPEQAANSREADVRSDIYSLGCTWYFMLSGAPPFTGKNAVELLRKHETEWPAPIRTLRRHVPDDIAELLERMMQKDPALRPQTPEDVLSALARSPSSGLCGRLTGSLSYPNNVEKLIGVLAWPGVWLPVLTCLACLIWLLLR